MKWVFPTALLIATVAMVHYGETGWAIFLAILLTMTAGDYA